MKALKKIIKTKQEWTSKELLNIIDNLTPKCKVTFFHIGGYELLKDGTKKEVLNSLEEIQDFLYESDIDYNKSITDPQKLASSVSEEWEEMCDDGGGSGWIEFE